MENSVAGALVSNVEFAFVGIVLRIVVTVGFLCAESVTIWKPPDQCVRTARANFVKNVRT